MYTPRKRHLKKKRFFLSNSKTFALLNASNLKASQIQKKRLLLKPSKLYFIPLYLTPTKHSIVCPSIMVVYDTLKELQISISEVASQINCLGVSINKKWYSINYFNRHKIKSLTNKTFALLLVKLKQLQNYQ